MPRSGTLQRILGNVAEPGRSRRMIRAPWSEGSSEEESRAYLQTRLTALYKLMFWCFVVLIGFLWAAYAFKKTDPPLAPALQRWVNVLFVGGMALQAFLWRGLLVRKKLSFDALHAIDTFYAVAANT